MASNSGLLLACLLLIATASSVVDSCRVVGVTKSVRRLRFVGHVVHPQLRGKSVAGLTVTVLRIKDKVPLCHGITDNSGKFDFGIEPALDFVFDASLYVLSIETPISGSGLTQTGFLQAPLGVVGLLTQLLGGILGLIAEFPCGGFTFVPIL
ncbi:hypothetical protein PanWU01x14_209420 [Parasponia andersonii]|uniref:Uncharacterized protein n=1 Tax=Parasponia andersonii TaxID=3476 RepID=A0A2P5BUF7_PARAD|nr:hypothetical protein PanWU01x14_209420 [Parasponia andersonii]